MKRFDLVTFDFDGTLADSAPWFIGVLNDVAARHGFRRVTDSEIEVLRRLPTREVVKRLGVRFWQLPGIARELRRRSAESAGSIPLFEGVPELLAQLAASGVSVTVVSSNGESTVRAVLGDAARHISVFACSSSLFGKARKIGTVRKTLEVPAGRVLHVGDETRDVEAARKAGVQCGVVTYGYAAEAPLRAMMPDFIFDDVASIADACAEPLTR